MERIGYVELDREDSDGALRHSQEMYMRVF